MVIRYLPKILTAVLLAISILTSACAPATKVAVTQGFKPAKEIDKVYVIPFATTLVPEFFSESTFNAFVDILNRERKNTGVKIFPIVREETAETDPAWLLKQYYISGEIWSYSEKSGCCSTEMSVKARVSLHEPDKKDAAVEIFVPLELFFDHDRTTVLRERDKLAALLARKLADELLKSLRK